MQEKPKYDLEHLQREAEEAQKEYEQFSQDFDFMDKQKAKKSLYMYISEAKANGVKSTQIAKEMGMTDSWLSTLLKDPELQQLIKNKTYTFQKRKLRDRIEQASMKGINVIHDTLDDETAPAKDKIAAAKFAIEQAQGKASQQINVTGNLSHNVIARMNELQQSGDLIDVTSKRVIEGDVNDESDENKDEIDAWVQRSIPEYSTARDREKE